MTAEAAACTSSDVPMLHTACAAGRTSSFFARALTTPVPASPRTISATAPAAMKPKPTDRSVSRRRPRAR